MAVTVCLVLAEWWHLAHANLAVWTTYMVMAAPPTTIFQRGVERTLGRSTGILLGLGLAALFVDAPALLVALEAVCLALFFYLFFAGRLAYTFLNAGLYLVAIILIETTNPASAGQQGWGMFVAVLVGSLVADLVAWLTGAEHDLHISPGDAPLWPVRGDSLNRTLMLVVTAMLTQLLALWLGLPVEQAVISVMMLTTAPDIQAMLHKGELRLTGAVLGSAWGLGSFALLSRLPSFSLLAVLLLLGIFIAAYLARTAVANSYLGLQMGLVIPLALVVPPHEFGSVGSAVQRIEGVVMGLIVSLSVAAVWPLPSGGDAQR